MIYIQVWVCDVTRAVELYAMKDIKAASSVHNYLDIESRYGPITQISSDNGSDFASHLLESLTAALNAISRHPVADRPQAIGITERKNSSILGALRAMVIDNKLIQSKWSIYLPLVRKQLWLIRNRFTKCRPIDYYGGLVKLEESFQSPQAHATALHPDIKDAVQVARDLHRRTLRFQYAANTAKLATLPESSE